MNEAKTSDDFGTFVEPTTLVIRRWLPGPAERVWNYLTDSELRRKWLAAGDMVLAPGAPLELVWRNDELSDPSDPRPDGFSEEQRMKSHIISVDPMRQLTIAWGNGNVTFALEPQGDKVLLTVTHRGLDDRAAKLMIGAGWHMHLDILLADLTGTPADSFWSGWAKLKKTYDERVPD